MRRIKVKNLNKYILVDDDIYPLVKRHNWSGVRIGHLFYAATSIGVKGIYLHRLIYGTTHTRKRYLLDHIDGNGLNNQLSNLRMVTASVNTQNTKIRKGGVSRYLGVGKTHSKSRKWFAAIIKNGKSNRLGQHKTQTAAAHAYDDKAFEVYGPHAAFNFPKRIKRLHTL